MNDNTALVCIVAAILAACVVLIVTGHGQALVALAIIAVAFIVWRLFV